MFDQGPQFVSNRSTSAGFIASNTSWHEHPTMAVASINNQIGNSSVPRLSPSENSTQRGHQELREPIPYDILNIGTSYILGNIGLNNSGTESQLALQNSTTAIIHKSSDATTENQSNSNTQRAQVRRHVAAHHHRSSRRHQSGLQRVKKHGPNAETYTKLNTTPFTLSLHKRDGPVQCCPGSPCKDDSCCGREGKCGFKEPNCGAGCTSNCDAKAMCGIDSADGKTRCGLNLCCSYYGWYGTESVHCYDPEPQYGKTPCQQGFGSCQIYRSPSCSGRSASTGRRVGYYQGWNVRERLCDKVSPSQINIKGLTHLFYSFVFFDPSTFSIVPMNPSDVEMYREFTKLATNGLQTWVAIGGWSFSDPGPYHTTWSDMCASPAN